MPLDLTPPGDSPPPSPSLPGMDCIVIGGCANGGYLKDVQMGAERIELSRPIGVKPLASAIQKIPEIAREKDEYTVHPIGLYDQKGAISVVGIAVVAGRSLNWGVEQLMTGYVKNVTNEMLAAGVITKQ